MIGRIVLAVVIGYYLVFAGGPLRRQEYVVDGIARLRIYCERAECAGWCGWRRIAEGQGTGGQHNLIRRLVAGAIEITGYDHGQLACELSPFRFEYACTFFTCDFAYVVEMGVYRKEFFAMSDLSLKWLHVAIRVIAASQFLLPGTSGVSESQNVPDDCAISLSFL